MCGAWGRWKLIGQKKTLKICSEKKALQKHDCIRNGMPLAKRAAHSNAFMIRKLKESICFRNTLLLISLNIVFMELKWNLPSMSPFLNILDFH